FLYFVSCVMIDHYVALPSFRHCRGVTFGELTVDIGQAEILRLHYVRTKEEVQEILKTSSGYDPDDELLTPDDGPVSGLGGSSNS
ncbi:hypothetical protein Tco_1130454, partial [Tanacetum coccineum]